MQPPSPHALRRSASNQAFGRFYREHFGFVWHAVGRFGVGDPERGDVVQETFLAAYRRDADRLETPRAWLYGAARRMASNHRRGAARAHRKHSALAHSGAAAVCVTATEALGALERFLETLDDGDRELFVLSELEGLRGAELAAMLGVELPRIYARLRLLRARVGAAAIDDAHVSWSRARTELSQRSMGAWLALVPMLPTKAAAVTSIATGGALAKVLAITTAIAVPSAVAASWLREAEPPHAAAPSEPATTAAATAAAGPAPAPAAIAIDSGASPPDLPEAAQPPARAAVSALAPAPAGARSSEDPTVLDNAMLRTAIEALGHGDAAAALAGLDRHAREFPDSAQADVRAALRVEALCAAGKPAQARGEAHAFVQRHPRSPLVDRVRGACPDAENSAAASIETP
ncbi:MAG: sigma-70 family RNA polymerase sigma factor [Deltaproteobacteria bacterium]|nr:sigma-70 family RNA polymerase sigma factor [Deltaproteobacteria bacterium]MBK8714143.1 sigma-70 family RNA polymerase sigma factor [Deltaproteobacteria bacterium]MBP7285603.1 sigma-70 family RNA polymerase sigma factor [Nannocystaceae bacterium]